MKSYHVGSIQPYSKAIMAESKAKLSELARKDKERMMLEKIRNDYESYIYKIKNTLIDKEEEVAAVTNQEQRDALQKSAEDAEEWMYDEGYGAGLETYEAKYKELTEPAEKMYFRMKEVPARAEAIVTLTGKLDKVVNLMKKWETSMPQITEEERNDVLAKVEIVRKWITEKAEAQASADPSADPVFTSEEVPLQTKDLHSIISKLSRRPKPTPPKEEKKNETDSEEGEKKTETETEATKDEESSEGKEEEASEEDAKDATEETKEEESQPESTEDDEKDESEGEL